MLASKLGLVEAHRQDSAIRPVLLAGNRVFEFEACAVLNN
jgi:hypothetical protein